MVAVEFSAALPPFSLNVARVSPGPIATFRQFVPFTTSMSAGLSLATSNTVASPDHTQTVAPSLPPAPSIAGAVVTKSVMSG